ncbi:MAG: hypothetical protein ACXADO_05655 [Candidatus Thorarchaeota archaeon]|jgi:hypothetical protein
MIPKILVIIATSDKEKALTAPMYAGTALRYSWMDDVKVMFFGPSQHLLVEDAEVAASAEEAASLTDTIACKLLSDRDGETEQTETMGIKVDYLGTIIYSLTKDGYVPMVW